MLQSDSRQPYHEALESFHDRPLAEEYVKKEMTVGQATGEMTVGRARARQAREEKTPRQATEEKKEGEQRGEGTVAGGVADAHCQQERDEGTGVAVPLDEEAFERVPTVWSYSVLDKSICREDGMTAKGERRRGRGRSRKEG